MTIPTIHRLVIVVFILFILVSIDQFLLVLLLLKQKVFSDPPKPLTFEPVVEPRNEPWNIFRPNTTPKTLYFDRYNFDNFSYLNEIPSPSNDTY